MMDDSEDFLLEIQDEFLDETVGFLEQTENNFLEFEANPHDHGILENILRLAHNIKGSAAAVGFDGLSHFAHTFENLLVKIKQGEIEPVPEIIDILLVSNDTLKSYVDALREDKSSDVDTSEVANRINNALEMGPQKTAAATVAADEPEEESVEFASIDPADYEEEQGPEQEQMAVESAPQISAAAAESLAELGISLDDIPQDETPAAATKVDYDALEDILMEETLSNVNEHDRPSYSEEHPPQADEVTGDPELEEQIEEALDDEMAEREISAGRIPSIPKATSTGPIKPKLEVVKDIPEALNAQMIEKASPNKAGKKTDEFIRLPLRKIEDLLNDLSEQVILQSSLDHLRQNIVENADDVNRTILQLGKITNELQQTAISLRMLSLRGVFSKMQRTIRDTAKILNKEIRFITDGDDTELDKTIIDELSSPLTHLIRNSVDHGIESPEEREKWETKNRYSYDDCIL